MVPVRLVKELEQANAEGAVHLNEAVIKTIYPGKFGDAELAATVVFKMVEKDKG
jgi:hypothetical protein